MIGIPIGLVYCNVGEWLIHKYILHGLGKRRSSFWSFHWHEHHKASRKHGMSDAAYERPLSGWNAQTKEALAIFGIALAHAPLFPVAPFFTATVWYSAVYYHHVHRRAHLDPVWADEHLPWHVDHHLGQNQHANWCVSRPWFDEWVGTRVPRSVSTSVTA
jgi:hypothetical protein